MNFSAEERAWLCEHLNFLCSANIHVYNLNIIIIYTRVCVYDGKSKKEYFQLSPKVKNVKKIENFPFSCHIPIKILRKNIDYM